MKALMVLFVATLLSGCEVLGIARECTTELRFGVIVTPVDSATNGPVQSDTIVVTATDGSYADTAMITDYTRNGLPSLPLVERGGTFRVEMNATGYETWTKNGVRVTEDACGHQRTVRLTALMHR